MLGMVGQGLPAAGHGQWRGCHCWCARPAGAAGRAPGGFPARSAPPHCRLPRLASSLCNRNGVNHSGPVHRLARDGCHSQVLMACTSLQAFHQLMYGTVQAHSCRALSRQRAGALSYGYWNRLWHPALHPAPLLQRASVCTACSSRPLNNGCCTC